MHGLKTSFATFTKISRKPTKKLIQPIAVKHKILMRGNLQLCIECKGIPRITPDGNVTGFQRKSLPYNHKSDCSQANRF